MSPDDRYTVPGRYWHPLEDGRVQCDVRPRACRLREVPAAGPRSDVPVLPAG